MLWREPSQDDKKQHWKERHVQYRRAPKRNVNAITPKEMHDAVSNNRT